LKLSEYKTIKTQIKQYNIELNDLKNQYTKYNKIYNDLYNKITLNFNYKQIRTYILKEIRNKIISKYIFNNDKETAIKVHIIDCSIKLASASFKSALTNYIEGNHKIFKIRYWKKDRSKKVMEIEPSFIKNGLICKNVFGKIKMRYKDSLNGWTDYKLDTKKAIKLHYDSKTETYSLFVPINIDTIKSNAEEDSFIGIDQGIRTNATCIAKNEAIKFGTNISEKIKEIINKIDKINENENLLQEDKNKCTAKHYKRISNLIDEMHWKIINYLTNNYDRIYIGKLNM
jgi:hypothetical protein